VNVVSPSYHPRFTWYEITERAARDKHKVGLPTCVLKVAASVREKAAKPDGDGATCCRDNGSHKDPVMYTDTHGSFALSSLSYDRPLLSLLGCA
jgi:hypothetical protein